MTDQPWDFILYNALIANSDKTAIGIRDDKIVWMGHSQEMGAIACQEKIDIGGELITPGFIDCHTHLVYGGDRSSEYERRLLGVSYETIAREGGGIQKTVADTREVSEDLLLAESLVRAESLLRYGVTTVEIKSGYGLNWETESKMLRVAKRIGEVLPLTVKRTFLGAHTLPKEFAGNADAYVKQLCDEWIPRVASEALADTVDVFCEHIAFSLAQTEKIFEAATKYNLRVKCHAEQLSCSGSAALAAKYQALSVDHLEFISEDQVAKLAEASVVAVLLPGAYYYLKEKQKPPIDWFRQYQVPMAVSTDCNPGTSPTTNLPLMMNMACVQFGLTPEEVYLGVTLHAAQALGLPSAKIAVGEPVNLVWWNAKHPREFAYRVGDVQAKRVFKAVVSSVQI